jgi:ATP-dependent Clp protease ATP-binding subunit ClpC
MYFAFRAIHDNTQSPVVGRVLAQVQPWWLENTYVVQVLHPFISDRAKAGEKMSFGNLLSGFDEHRTKNLEALLRQLNREELRSLSDELSSHAVSVIDHSFLNSFGRIWTAGDVSDSVYENPALMLHVEKIKDTLLKTPNRSVLLVGERGVGKTSLIKRVVREIHQDHWEIFEASASDVLAGRIYVGQLEERLQLLVRNLQVRKKVV